MMTSIVVTIVGPDRPGLVSAISDKAAEFGANWADSLMANLAGQFAGIVHLHVPGSNADFLMAALRGLETPGMQLLVVKGIDGGAKASAARRLRLGLVGQDRPGIIKSISSQLARLGISIDNLQTQISSAPMSGEQLFQMQALLMMPASVDEEALRAALEGLENELMVDISLDDSLVGK